jgi:hypothetical protein
MAELDESSIEESFLASEGIMASNASRSASSHVPGN